MIRTDTGHGRGWLAPAPAASVRRIDAQLGRPAQSTEMGRTRERQAYLRDGWERGLPGFAFALPAGESEHEQGDAWDTNEWYNADVAAVLEANGWRRTALARGEGWHGEYFPHLDQHINDPQEDDMPLTKDDIDKIARAVWNYQIGENGNKGRNNMPAWKRLGRAEWFARLASAAADWIKARIGGSVKDEAVGNVVAWIKTRIGGSVNGPSIDAQLKD